MSQPIIQIEPTDWMFESLPSIFENIEVDISYILIENNPNHLIHLIGKADVYGVRYFFIAIYDECDTENCLQLLQVGALASNDEVDFDIGAVEYNVSTKDPEKLEMFFRKQSKFFSEYLLENGKYDEEFLSTRS